MQYGHARLCSILRKAGDAGIAVPSRLAPEDWAKLVHPDELGLARKLADYGSVVAQAAENREPHRVLFYVQELARDFQSYFTRLKGDSDPVLPPASVPKRRKAGRPPGTSPRRGHASRGSRPSARSMRRPSP